MLDCWYTFQERKVAAKCRPAGISRFVQKPAKIINEIMIDEQ